MHLENLMNSGFSEGRVDPYLFPARGRKLRIKLIGPMTSYGVDPYLFPARGRKRHSIDLHVECYNREVDPYLFPARGRKQD